jgi:hypothetical protein
VLVVIPENNATIESNWKQVLLQHAHVKTLAIQCQSQSKEF